MRYKNKHLHDAVQAYVQAALDFITKRAGTDATPPDAGEDYFFFTRLSAGAKLTALPEYRSCREALLDDPQIAGQLDVLAGTSSRRSRSPTAEQLMLQIPDLGIRDGRYEFDTKHFELEYAAFEEAYYNPDILYEVVAPLQGLLIDGPVRLSDDLEISELKEGELSQGGRARRGTRSEAHEGGKPCAVRSICRLPKVIGDDVGIDLEESKRDEAKRAEANDRVGQVVNALRLCGIESVFPAAVIHRTSQWSFGHDRVFPGRFQPDIHFATKADGAWLSSFKQFWDGLQSEGVRKHKFLDVAVRRYSYAHERHRLEDKIVDLLVAAEALFLSDYNKADPYIGEIRFRMSLRAALFLNTNGESRRRVFRQMRAAYDLRSSIVHGGDTGKVKLPPQPDGSPTPVEDFVWTIQEYMRIALQKAIGLALLPETPMALVNWDELIF
jgi:hypothetical protein